MLSFYALAQTLLMGRSIQGSMEGFLHEKNIFHRFSPPLFNCLTQSGSLIITHMYF